MKHYNDGLDDKEEGLKSMICHMKSAGKDLTERERRKISETVRNMVMSYDLDYLLVLNLEKK